MQTIDIPATFPQLFRDACADEIHCHPLDLLGVMFSESGCHANAVNPNGHAVGIIQFMPAILPGVNFKGSWEDFSRLNACEQLPHVVIYFRQWAAKFGIKQWASSAQLYQATFLPATLAKGTDPELVIAAKGGVLGWAYSANAVFDANGDGSITVGELELAIERNCRGPRWDELVKLVTGEDLSSHLDADDLRTTAGVQAALNACGWNLTVDGIPGPATRAAVMSFQSQIGLTVDGIPGPKTQAAILAELG